MLFADRPPSSTWEQIPFGDEPQTWFWAWFKPLAAPHGLVVRIPEETHRNPARRFPVTLRRVLAATGIAPPWSPPGRCLAPRMTPCRGRTRRSIFRFPSPGWASIRRCISFCTSFPRRWSSPTAARGHDASGDTDRTRGRRVRPNRRRVESLPALEVQLAAAAKQLNATLLRINSLNRDLSSDEGRAADQLDKKEWQEARRWLRDVANRVSRFLKDHHIGMTSSAGKRRSFETIYEQYVVPRRHFDGIVQSERDFEQYHKTLQTLLNNMNAAQTSATQDGERRAQQILTRIGAKVRGARGEKMTAGTKSS